jgi:hypothetical protein
MPGKLERIVFSDATAAIFVKKKTKGTRSTKRHATKGRQGSTDRISLWRELMLEMIKAKQGAGGKCRTRSPRCVRNLELL